MSADRAASSLNEGDTLNNGRYVIRGSAGRGVYGAVYWASDERDLQHVPEAPRPSRAPKPEATWPGKPRPPSIAHGRVRAIKVSRSEGRFLKASEAEVRLLRRASARLGDADPRYGFDSARPPLVRILDAFHVELPDKAGVQQIHQVAVLEALAFDVSHLIHHVASRGRLPLPWVRALASQTLAAVSYMHDTLQVIHADIKPSNILVHVDAATLPWLDALRDALYDECDALDRHTTLSPAVVPFTGQRGRNPAPRSFLSPDSTTSSACSDYFGNSPRSSDSNSTSPSQSLVGLSSLAPSAGALGFGLGHTAPRFVLCDLSNAVAKHSKDKWPVVQSRHFRAPEVILWMEWAEPIDIWSLACLFVEVATGESLFSSDWNVLAKEQVELLTARGWTEANLAHLLEEKHDHEHLTIITEVIGPFGVDLLRRADSGRLRTFFDKHYRLRPVPGGMRPWPLADVLVEKFRWSRIEAEAMADFLRPAFRLDPFQRVSAYEWWDHAWLRPDAGSYRESDDEVESDDGEDSDSDEDSPERQACMDELDRAVFGSPRASLDQDPTPLASPAA